MAKLTQKAHKNLHLQRKLRRVLVCPLFTVLITGCQTKPTAQQPALKSKSDLMQSVEFRLIRSEACPTDDVERDPNRQLLSYEVALKTTEVIPINYRYASLITKKGKRYLAEHLGCQPLFNEAPSKMDEETKGFLNFALPSSEQPLRIEYQPELDHLSFVNEDPTAAEPVFEIHLEEKSTP